jgi:hypothetical protein
MSDGRRRGLVWSLPVARSDVLGKLGPAFGIGAGCGVGVGFGLIGGAYPCPTFPRPASSVAAIDAFTDQTGELEGSPWF